MEMAALRQPIRAPICATARLVISSYMKATIDIEPGGAVDLRPAGAPIPGRAGRRETIRLPCQDPELRADQVASYEIRATFTKRDGEARNP